MINDPNLPKDIYNKKPLKAEGFNDRNFCYIDKDNNCYGTPIPKDKNRKSWNEFVPNKPYHHIPEENIMIQKSGAFMMSIFLIIFTKMKKNMIMLVKKQKKQLKYGKLIP